MRTAGSVTEGTEGTEEMDRTDGARGGADERRKGREKALVRSPGALGHDDVQQPLQPLNGGWGLGRG